MSFIISGRGVRNAWSYNGNAALSPELVIEYSLVSDFPVVKNSRWLYLDNGTDLGTTWRGLTFNDSAWSYGNGILGYSDPSVRRSKHK